MFASRTICAACRLRLASNSASPVVSIRRACRKQPASTTAAAEPSPSPTSQAPTTSDQSQHSTPLDDAKRHAFTKHQSISKSRGFARRDKAGSRALDLFESTVNAAQQAELESKIDIDGLLRQANRIEETLRSERAGKLTAAQTAEACYSIVVEDILNVLDRVDGGRLPQAVQAAAGEAMLKTIKVKFTAEGEHLPSAAALCKVLAGLESKWPTQLDPYIALLEHISAQAASTKSTEEFDPLLLEDLLACWHDLTVVGRPVPEPPSSQPSLDGNHHPRPRVQREASAALRKLFPTLAHHTGPRLTVVLVGTYAVFQDDRSRHLIQKPNFGTLQATLRRLIDKIDMRSVEPYFSDHPQLWSYVEPSIQPLIVEPPVEPSTKGPAVKSEKAPAQSAPKGHLSYVFWHKKFSALFKFNDVRGLTDAWRELTEPNDDPDRATKLRHCPELFDFILYQCCSKYGQGSKAFQGLIEQTLAYMQKIHLQPTVRTFTSMMEGWKLARQFDRIESLWQRVVRSKVKLDKYIWSSRISACSTLGQPNDGIKALEEMSKTWEQSVAEGKSAAAVKPDVSSVNAAISGLLRVDRIDAVRTILAWASSKKIEPDIYTYNRLLDHMLKKGMTAEADKILTSMKAQGVEPDGATFTIILSTALAEMAEQAPAEQRATIARLFADMAACGITPNLETYAKMLHVLTRDAQHDDAHPDDRAAVAVEAVLAHLRGAGLPLSPEICTILLEFYFARRTPRDWDAIRALVADRRSRTRVLTDRAFWERVMSHYHAAGEMHAALDIFYDMNEWGLWASLPVLEPMLRTLVHQGDAVQARKLVATVQGQARPTATAEPKARYWKHAFWAVARENGLMHDIPG